MKFNKICLFLIIVSNVVFSQNGYIYYKKKLIANDNNTNQYVKQALKQLNDQEYKLSFNANIALYKKEETMSVEVINPVVEAFTRSFSGFRGEVYYDRIKNRIIHKKEYLGQIFLINKKRIHWQLTKDTLKIDGYLCYKAKAIRTIQNSEGLHELDVIAWYTTDIPLPYGPDGYAGLPGLILQLEDNGTLTYVQKIKFLKNKTNMISLLENGEKITEEKFNAIVKKTFENRKYNKN